MSAPSSPRDGELPENHGEYYWDETREHFPLFYLTDIPDDYFEELNTCQENVWNKWHQQGLFDLEERTWTAVSSPSPSYPQLLAEIKAHLDGDCTKPFPTPFIGQTILQVYSFFKHHLRRPDDQGYSFHAFTRFTFLAVDAECVHQTSTLPPLIKRYSHRTDFKYTILVCTDTPDWHETGEQGRLKTLRLPISAAVEHLDALEGCTITPSEVYSSVFEDEHAQVLKVFPMPSLLPIAPITMDEDQAYKPSSPMEMRWYKSSALRLEEEKERVEWVGEVD